MQATFRSVTWLGIIASVICVIPVLFYDLSEKKHADYIRALKIRAAVRNYKDHTMGGGRYQEYKNNLRIRKGGK